MLINDRTSRVIKMFCSVHNERFELLEPYVANGYIYATDTFSVIRVPTSLEEDENTLRLPPSETYSAGKKFPLQVIESVYEKPVVVYDYVIRVSQLDTLFESFKKVPVLDYSYQIKCPKCHGDGEIECSHCNNDYECPNCNGEGTVGKPKPTGELMFDENIYVIIKDTTVVSGSYLLRVREVAKEINQDTITIQWVDRKDYIDPIDKNPCYNTQPIFFQVGDALIVIMPLKHKKDPKYNAENTQVVTL